MKQITIANDHLNVAVDLLGAELASLCDRYGTEHLWQGDSRYWTGRAPVLFPIVGGLKHDQYVLDGHVYHLHKHGFARTSPFTVLHADAGSVSLILESNDDTRQGYPYDFRLIVRYTLQGSSLQVDYVIENRSDRTLYASIGAHEGYACPEGIEAYELVFEQEEALFSSQVDGNLLNGVSLPVLTDGAVLPLRTGYFAIDALIFTDIRSQSVTLAKRGGGRRIRVSYAGFPHLGIWTKPGAPYLCIEPWAGLPDEINATGELSEKRAILAVPASAGLTRTHTITIEP